MSVITVRPAAATDYASFARLFPELQVGDPVPGEERWSNEMRGGTIIAESSGRVVGYSFFQLIGDTGYVRHVVTAPEARGCGVGTALMAALRQRFRDGGAVSWELNVKPDNQAAIRVYERQGMRPLFQSTALGLTWDVVTRLPGPAVPVTVRIVPPHEDASFERAFHLIAGQLHSGRRLPGRVIMGASYVADGTPAGIAIFDPAFPGASPFRVAHPSFVGSLLSGLQPHALLDHPTLNLFVEDNAAAAAALVAAGAHVRLVALHYHGAL